jgi:hypothetical protein
VVNWLRYSAHDCSGCSGLACVPTPVRRSSPLLPASAVGHTPLGGHKWPPGHLLPLWPLEGGVQRGGTFSVGHMPELQISSMSMSENCESSGLILRHARGPITNPARTHGAGWPKRSYRAGLGEVVVREQLLRVELIEEAGLSLRAPEHICVVAICGTGAT